MSKMAELDYDIQELYIDGLSAREISRRLECSVSDVLACLKAMGVEDAGPAISDGALAFQTMVEELSPFETVNS
jgi:predicted transcriptional regulator with HTH domain